MQNHKLCTRRWTPPSSPPTAGSTYSPMPLRVPARLRGRGIRRRIHRPQKEKALALPLARRSPRRSPRPPPQTQRRARRGGEAGRASGGSRGEKNVQGEREKGGGSARAGEFDRATAEGFVWMTARPGIPTGFKSFSPALTRSGYAGFTAKISFNPNGVASPRCHLIQLLQSLFYFSRLTRRSLTSSRNAGLNDAIPSGLKASAGEPGRKAGKNSLLVERIKVRAKRVKWT